MVNYVCNKLRCFVRFLFPYFSPSFHRAGVAFVPYGLDEVFDAKVLVAIYYVNAYAALQAMDFRKRNRHSTRYLVSYLMLVIQKLVVDHGLVNSFF